MNLSSLQTALKISGKYTGAIDGIYGPATKAAITDLLDHGDSRSLTSADFAASASRLGCPVQNIGAITTVESAGHGFISDEPVLLFEPHRFSKATGHVFDKLYPSVSYPVWDPSKYPATQAGRYVQLLDAIGLDVDAGFASASYGRFQILGENFKACGFLTSYDFARAQGVSEVQQLIAFENFVKSNITLLAALRKGDWVTVARLYNGTAYAKNQYDKKLATAAASFQV